VPSAGRLLLVVEGTQRDTDSVPWCESCSTFSEVDELTEDGACPGCGTVLVRKRKIPWHFKVVIVVTTGYVIFRCYQGVMWLSHHI